MYSKPSEFTVPQEHDIKVAYYGGEDHEHGVLSKQSFGQIMPSEIVVNIANNKYLNSFFISVTFLRVVKSSRKISL